MLIVNQVIPHALKRKTDYIFILFATQISIQVVLLFVQRKGPIYAAFNKVFIGRQIKS